MKDMNWIEAIIAVLAEAGRPMHIDDIFEKIPKGVYRADAKTPENSLNRYLSSNKKIFRQLGKGFYELIDTSVTAPPAGGAAPVVVARPSTSYTPSDPKYKRASDFVKGSSLLSPLEMNLLELIVNLEKGEVCFADILDDLKVEISEERKSRPQAVDATILREKLGELKEQIADMEAEAEHNNESGDKLSRMRSAAEKAERRLKEVSDGEVKFEYPVLGEFIPGSEPKVVIYLKSIEKSIVGIESRWDVMAGVFVHEMFHAWNYFIAGGRMPVLAIDEPMVEFETLYFLKELEVFTESQSHSLRNNVLCVRLTREFRVKKKQQAIGNVAAYGFGYYLYDLYKKFGKCKVDAIKWIETYSKKSTSISHPDVKKVEKALIPVYPFKSEDKVFKWFEKIIFSGRATLATTGMSTAIKVGLSVSLYDLVRACIETIGRKCFEAKELYAFAPIFKVCMPQCENLEDALKHQLDELVKEGLLDALPHDCYSMKLVDIEVKPMIPVSTPTTIASAPTKFKGGYTKAPSIPFAVEFPDDNVRFNEKTAVKTFIKSLKHIGLNNVQSVGIMESGYNLVSDVERPRDGKNKWQDYVDNKYIYTKLGNEDKKRHLYQIANELGINIKIYDI